MLRKGTDSDKLWEKNSFRLCISSISDTITPFFPLSPFDSDSAQPAVSYFPPHTHSLPQSFLHQHPLNPNMQPNSAPRGSHRAYTWYPHHIHTFIRKGWRRSKHIRDRDGALFDHPKCKKVVFLPNYTLNRWKMKLWLMRKHPFMIWWVIRGPRCQQLCFYSDRDKHTQTAQLNPDMKNSFFAVSLLLCSREHRLKRASHSSNKRSRLISLTSTCSGPKYLSSRSHRRWYNSLYFQPNQNKST